MNRECQSRFAGKKATVMGLGLFGGGAGVAAFLARHGALVTVTDLRPASQLAESIQALSSSTLTLHLGGHDGSDFTDTDIVVVNPAVPLDSPYLESARKAGVRLESEINIFLSFCPAPVVGITGSNGKTTTTVLIGEMLKAAGRNVWVGGNLGKSLLDCIDDMRRDHVVVLELSSFQLDMLDWVRTSPDTGVATNICPNHLDRHGSMASYIAAKRKMFAFQQPDDLAVLNFDDNEVSAWRRGIASRVSFFSRKERVPDGAFLADGRLCLVSKGKSNDVCPASDALIPGWFNTENILAAMCAAAEYGAKPAHIAQAVRGFKGVEHRLEFVGEFGGVKYYNDSIATNPQSTLAALDALPGSIVLIAGGFDKKLPLEEVARSAARRCKSIVLVGDTAPLLKELIENEPEHCGTAMCKTFDEAVSTACESAVAGDTVLLSPACASFDMFRNFADRGNRFKELVVAPGRHAIA